MLIWEDKHMSSTPPGPRTGPTATGPGTPGPGTPGPGTPAGPPPIPQAGTPVPGPPAGTPPPTTRGGFGRRIGLGLAAIAIAAGIGGAYFAGRSGGRDGYIPGSLYSDCETQVGLQYAINGAEELIYSRVGSALAQNDLPAIVGKAPVEYRDEVRNVSIQSILNDARFKAAQTRDAKLEACVTPAKPETPTFTYNDELRAVLLEGYQQAVDACHPSFSYTPHSGEFASHVAGALKQGGYIVDAQAIVDANGGDATKLIAGKPLTIPVA